jgi:hypothetical protein
MLAKRLRSWLSVELVALLASVATLSLSGCRPTPRGGDTRPAAVGAAAACTAGGLAIATSDYHSTAVSLMDPYRTEITKPSCITSSSPMPLARLSGDIALPSDVQPGHDIVLIDRTNATLTWVDCNCAVHRQMKVGSPTANPHDVISVSPTKVYVPLFDPSDNSVAVIDPMSAKVTGTIELKSFSQSGGGFSTLAAPDRGLFVNGKAYIVLGQTSADYATAAPARIIVIDPKLDKVTSTIELGKLTACGTLIYARKENLLFTECGGLLEDSRRIKQSGVAIVTLSHEPPTVKIVSASAFGFPLTSDYLAVLSPTRALTVVTGDVTTSRASELWSLDLAGGQPHRLMVGGDPVSLGAVVHKLPAGRVFVAEGPKLMVFDATDGAMPSLIKTIVTAPGARPPTQLGFY